MAVFGAQLGPQAEGGLTTALFYLICSFAVLLIPTAMMGATLPLLARHTVRSDREVGVRIGGLYATNTIGAVCGCLLAAFVLLPALGLAHTVWVAVATNGLVFAVAQARPRMLLLFVSRGTSNRSRMKTSR